MTVETITTSTTIRISEIDAKTIRALKQMHVEEFPTFDSRTCVHIKTSSAEDATRIHALLRVIKNNL